MRRWTGCSQQKKLVGDLRRIGRADFKPKLSANLRKLKDKLVAAYQEAGFQPPEPAQLRRPGGRQRGQPEGPVRGLRRRGAWCASADDIYLHADAEAEMRRLVDGRLAEGRPGLTVAEIRDLLGTTRKYAVPLCEYLDRVGVTRREGDLRLLATVRSSGAVA